MVVRLVAQSDLLRTLPPKRFSVSVLMHGGGVPHRNSIWITLQSAAKPDQIVCKTTMPTMAGSGPARSRPTARSGDWAAR